MQRAVARFLFAVLWLSSIAPAFAFAPPTAPIACHRPPLHEKSEAPPAEMPDCHGMSGGSEKAQASLPASELRDAIDKDDCCNEHECCRRLDRSQGISLTTAITLYRVDTATVAVPLAVAPDYVAVSLDRPSGRAPPLL